MEYPVHTDICISVVLKQNILTPYQKLGTAQRGRKAVPTINYLKEISALIVIWLHESEIVND